MDNRSGEISVQQSNIEQNEASSTKDENCEQNKKDLTQMKSELNKEDLSQVKSEKNKEDLTQMKSEQNKEDLTQQVEKKSRVESGKLPKSLTDMFKPLRCELCNVEATSPVVAYTHYEGKVHRKAVNAYMALHYPGQSLLTSSITCSESTSGKTELKNNKCNVCNIVVSSYTSYLQHLAGRQHSKKVKLLNSEASSKMKADTTDDTRSPSSIKSFNKTPYFCETCAIFTDTEQQMGFHKRSKSHQKKKFLREKLTACVQVSSVKPEDEFYNEEDVWQASPTTPKKDP